MPSHKAILTGYNWNSEPTMAPQKAPIFLTYSFAADTFWGYTRFNTADKKLARYALRQWGDACGIRFIETKSKSSEIKFSWFDDSSSDVLGYAYFPRLYTAAGCKRGEVVEREWLIGNVYLNSAYEADFKNKSYKTYVLLHEIGHALGLKHPFHKSPYNKRLLSNADDHAQNTVMSYDNGASDIYPTKLRQLDKMAVKELYGSSKSDGRHLSGWSWSRKKETLTQIAKKGDDKIHGTGVKDVILGLGGNDRLFGFDGDDTLIGGAGNDTLKGSFGDDVFVFDSPLDPASNVDKIVHFDEYDSIRLASTIFPKLPVGQLGPQYFSGTGAAKDANDFIVFDMSSGRLYYDPDGTGLAEKVLFAKLTKRWSDDPSYLDASDFYIV